MNTTDLLKLWETSFEQLGDELFATLSATEHLVMELGGEQSHFMRLNRAKVRQTGIVTDATIKLRLMCDQRTAYASFPFTGDLSQDRAIALENLNYLRQTLPQLPIDPYIVLPQNQGSSRAVYPGNLLDPDHVADAILPTVAKDYFTGIYAAGPIVRANRNSAGQNHWFATETFFLDYSMLTPSEKAVKGNIAGAEWDQGHFEVQIAQAQRQEVILDRPVKTLAPGEYRTYFAPAAVSELLGMLSWGGVSEASIRQGGSALAKLREGKALSAHLTIQENFGQGMVPRFNDLGEVAPTHLPIIAAGQLENTLVSARTAKEYGVESNAAAMGEGLRAAEICPGALSQADILQALDTGLYISNLHYLNWSDRTGGRITGMTRYACFWVEKGEIRVPIRDLRFDDSLYSFWGDNLEAVTDVQEFIPEVDTYEQRSLGGNLVPGMLVKDFKFTL